MTDKKLKVGNTAYTELSIQIGVLEAKVDKILQILLEGSKGVNVGPVQISGISSADRLEISKAIGGFVALSNEEFDRKFK